MDVLRVLISCAVDTPSMVWIANTPSCGTPASQQASHAGVGPAVVQTIAEWIECIGGDAGLLKYAWRFVLGADARVESSQQVSVSTAPPVDPSMWRVFRTTASQTIDEDLARAAFEALAENLAGRCARFYAICVAVQQFWEAARRRVHGQVWRLGDMRKSLVTVRGLALQRSCLFRSCEVT